ncbi:MAG TPA: amidohydrolase family protein [Firmicutes bacterium]|nr:amidohydrolase family protein [Bacillota bacterium]
MLDLLLKNARIVDGTGAPWFLGNIGIQEGKIVYVGPDAPPAYQSIAVQEKVVAPGFIDIHSHSDFVYFSDPANTPKLLQGVTTEVNGNCGLSAAPVSEEYLDELRRYTGFVQAGQSCSWNWRSFGDYLNELEKLPLALNVAACVGQGSVRIAVMGFADRTPTPGELARMQELVAESMDSGAFGVSTGLIYPPGVYCSTEELIEVCKPAASRGGVYFTHMRNESNRQLDALREALRIGREAGMPVQIAHHKVGGKPNWGQSRETLALIEKARAEGQDVTLDQYPYTAGSTTLSAVLPPWAQAGGVQALLERLRAESSRPKIKEAIAQDSNWENLVLFSGGWDGVLITAAPKTPEYEGKTVLEAAKLAGKAPDDLALDIVLANEGSAACCVFMMHEEDVKNIMRHPAVMVGSDGIPAPPGAKAHPRMAGTFPRVLGHYVREEKVLTFEEAVRKMTALPARRLGLFQKGLIQPGCDADLVVFDPETIGDCATYQEPSAAPTGIEYVFVGGTLVLDHGQLTGAHPGKVLRHRR